MFYVGNAAFASTISQEYDVVMGSLYILFCVLSLLGNCILLLVAYHKRSTLKPAEFFIVNLSASDLGMTLFLFPMAISSSFSHRTARVPTGSVHMEVTLSQLAARPLTNFL
ncbi:opsin-5-like isoform X2 [Syngnathoides biaculeatus]|uniref:opsin-5-like isoform X2 n=1 Tax=Syngnathoides biaculeatus TaxID=300417 RepID=UPI002ADE78CA|nr:opsin-5-like isoform X2 [Syngnathoides biaculeatus]